MTSQAGCDCQGGVVSPPRQGVAWHRRWGRGVCAVMRAFKLLQRGKGLSHHCGWEGKHWVSSRTASNVHIQRRSQRVSSSPFLMSFSALTAMYTRPHPSQRHSSQHAFCSPIPPKSLHFACDLVHRRTSYIAFVHTTAVNELGAEARCQADVACLDASRWQHLPMFAK